MLTLISEYDIISIYQKGDYVMVELFRNIVTDYFLFSLIESYIFVKFFEVVGGCKKFKWWEIGLLSLVNCVVSQTLPPILYQVIGLIYMGAYIKIRDNMKIKDSAKIVLFSSLYMLVIEMIYNILFATLGILDGFLVNDITLFLFMIPIRIVEISILILGVHKMANGKWWLGDNIKRK